jgi:putative transcriptional regulator
MMGTVESLRGRLLIAGSSLSDPNFRRAVVLVGEHNEDGALGVILNRPAPARVREVVPTLGDLVAEDEHIFIGGPVQPQGAVVLADFRDPQRSGLLVFGSIGFLLGDVEEGDLRTVHRARVFAGYAGWGPGQLEQEMREASWIAEPARPDDVFSPDPSSLWGDVLRRKGEDYRLLALMPEDPSLN